MGIDLGLIIDGADLTDDDREIGTSMLCGTFALAVNRMFPATTIALLCFRDSAGRPMRSEKDGGLLWRHAVVVHEGELFDVDGRVRLDHLVANHCWDNPEHAGGILVTVDEPRFLDILLEDAKSYDEKYFRIWTDKLASSCTTRGVPTM